MEASCVRQTLIPGTSKLFADYLYDFERVAQFYPYYFEDSDAFLDSAKRVDYPASRRAAMVSALREQNGESAALTKFAEPGTLAVVTGQQVGLFSGPAYTVYKALTAVRLTQHLETLGIQAVPVFWLATEDHDLAEVDHAWVFDEAATPAKIKIEHPYVNGGPVGQVRLNDLPIDALRAALGKLPFADEVVERIRDAYCDGATLGSAFKSLLGDVLAKFELLYLDPLAPAVREVAAPLLQNAARAIPDLISAVRRRNEELTAAGYHAQVNVEQDTSLLFLLENGKRTPLRWKDGKLAGKDRTYSIQDVCSNPTAISPNALLRPVMQDHLLPTVADIGGPAEIAYIAQSQVLYQKLLGRMPVIFPRNGFTLLDARASKILSKYGLKALDLLECHEAVRTRMARKLVPAELLDKFSQLRSELGGRLGELASQLHDFDPTLDAAAGKSLAKIQYQMEKLSRKTANETLRRDERASSDAAYVLNLVYPERHLQERVYSIVPFLARSGMDLPVRLLDETRVNCPDHMIRAI